LSFGGFTFNGSLPCITRAGEIAGDDGVLSSFEIAGDGMMANAPLSGSVGATSARPRRFGPPGEEDDGRAMRELRCPRILPQSCVSAHRDFSESDRYPSQGSVDDDLAKSG
jgi:hypothetical protein